VGLRAQGSSLRVSSRAALHTCRVIRPPDAGPAAHGRARPSFRPSPAADCARGYERQPCGKDAECCRRCAKGTAWVGGECGTRAGVERVQRGPRSGSPGVGHEASTPSPSRAPRRGPSAPHAHPPKHPPDTPPHPPRARPSHAPPPEGLACEPIPDGTRLFSFGATVELDRACNDPAAAATLSTVKAAVGDASADIDTATLYVGLAKCDNVLKDATLGTVGGYYATYSFRVEYWGSSGTGASEVAAAVRANPSLFCGDRGEFYSSRCVSGVREPGPGKVTKPLLARSWSVSLPIQIDDAPVADGGACPEGSRLKDLEKSARAALAPALRNLVGLRQLKKVTFVQCNRIAPLNSGQIELWFSVDEKHEFDPNTGQGPYETLFASGVYGEDAGGILDALPTLATLQPPVAPELAYVGPPLTCLPGGPRQPPNEDPTDVTPSPVYYLANDGKLVSMGPYWDPRVITPMGLILKEGGAALDLLDSEDTGTTDVIVLNANGVRGKFTGDKLVAVRGGEAGGAGRRGWGEGRGRGPHARAQRSKSAAPHPAPKRAADLFLSRPPGPAASLDRPAPCFTVRPSATRS
jgi:hypothetical protein